MVHSRKSGGGEGGRLGAFGEGWGGGFLDIPSTEGLGTDSLLKQLR